jgi:DNA-binding NarL/FixJ family response regulator
MYPIYPGSGYLAACAGGVDDQAVAADQVATDQVATGRAALRVGDAGGARALFEQVEPTPEVLEGLAAASYVLIEYPRAIAEYERAYAGYRAANDGAGSAKVARILGYLNGSTAGDWAIASGWIARAKTLLGDLPDSDERGWVALTEGMFDGNRAMKERSFQTALRIGHETRDADLTFSASAYLGASLVHGDRVEEGMALLDEALAAIAGGEVEDFIIVEEIFCQLFSACEHAQDVHRAEQWIRVGEQIAERLKLPAVSAYCRTHYGGILTAAGRWREADATLTEAVRLWALGKRTLKAGALVRLADLRVKQGRYDEAASLLEGQHDDESIRPRAALHLARGEVEVAKELLERAAQKADPGSSSCIPLLALLVDAQLASDLDPNGTIEAMAACAAAHPSPYANAVVALARGRAGLGDPKAWLRDALDGFMQARLPLEASLCRLDLAAACTQTNPEVAIAEAREALKSFEKLEAARYVDAATAVLRDLGQKVAPPRSSGGSLTKRELDVLALIGAGRSNPEIAEQLFISRKTVEHHVGNILAKLGLRNRTELAGYAARQGPATK